MNKKLQVPDKDLPRVLGEVLQPEMNRHTIATNQHGRGNCTKCGRNLDWSQWHKTCSADSPVDPIPIDDWNVAMEWRDWAVAGYNEAWWQAMWEVHVYYCPTASATQEWDEQMMEWFLAYAQPKHYLKAAAQCKLESENK